MDIEIEKLKTVNLEIIAINYGFKLTNKATKNSPHFNNGKDTIIIKQQSNGVYTFWSPSSNQKGDVFKLIEWQENCDFKTALNKAQEILNSNISIPNEKLYKNLDKKNFNKELPKKFVSLEYSVYLESRGIPSSFLQHKRFKDTIFFNPEFKNVVFPHYNQKLEVIGYTQKNFNFSGFAEGGEKTIWHSKEFPSDKRLVIGEAAIDMLSLAYFDYLRTPKDFFNNRYISIDGGWNPDLTTKSIQAQIESLKNNNVIVIGAFDNDTQGKKYSHVLADLCQKLDVQYQENLPKISKDWNEALQSYQAKQSRATKYLNDKTIGLWQKGKIDIYAIFSAIVDHNEETQGSGVDKNREVTFIIGNKKNAENHYMDIKNSKNPPLGTFFYSELVGINDILELRQMVACEAQFLDYLIHNSDVIDINYSRHREEQSMSIAKG